jgi:hypothetical protein
VLALRALALSAPYDVPPWLPGVLSVLVRAGADPPPVRTLTSNPTLARTRWSLCGH